MDFKNLFEKFNEEGKLPHVRTTKPSNMIPIVGTET